MKMDPLYYGSALSTRETLQNTAFYTQHVIDQDIPGALVECGIAAGSQVGAMYDTMLKSNKTRWVYGFDSFDGIPLASEDDDEQPGMDAKPVLYYKDKRELLKSSGISSNSIEDVRWNMRRWFPGKDDKVVLVKGWFQDTVYPYKTVMSQLGGIALLRLDGDLYESTKVCLEALFEHINPGGILIIDYWNLRGCRKACEEFFATHPVTRLSEPFQIANDTPAYFQV